MRRSFLLLVSLCSYSYSINPIALVLPLRVGQDFLIGRIWWFRPQHEATLRLEEKNMLLHCCNLVDVVSMIFGKASTLGTLPTSFTHPPCSVHCMAPMWLPQLQSHFHQAKAQPNTQTWLPTRSAGTFETVHPRPSALDAMDQAMGGLGEHHPSTRRSWIWGIAGTIWPRICSWNAAQSIPIGNTNCLG